MARLREQLIAKSLVLVYVTSRYGGLRLCLGFSAGQVNRTRIWAQKPVPGSDQLMPLLCYSKYFASLSLIKPKLVALEEAIA